MGKLMLLLLAVIVTCVSTREVVAQDEWGQEAVFFVEKVTPKIDTNPASMDSMIRNGDYITLRGPSNGTHNLTIENGVVTGAEPQRVQKFYVVKVTEKDPANPATIDLALHGGDLIKIKGDGGSEWVSISGHTVYAQQLEGGASKLFIKKVTPQHKNIPDSLKDTIHTGDYLNIRGTEGERWLHFIGMRLFAGKPIVETASETIKVHASRPLPADNPDPSCGASVNGGVIPFRSANCESPCVVLPQGKKMVRVTFWARNGSTFEFSQCISNQDCPINYSKWWNSPEVYDNGRKICGNFKNWAHTTDREAKITVEYD